MADPRLIPPSVADSRTVGLAALSDRLDALDLDLLRNLYDPMHCPTSALPFLAQQFGVLDEAWVLAGTEAARRGLVSKALTLQKLRGTVAGLKQALAAIGWPGLVIEERTSHWAKFKVTQPLGGRAVPPEELARLVPVIEAWKPARCVLESLEFGVTFESSVSGTGPRYDGAYTHDGTIKYEGVAVANIAYAKVGQGTPTVRIDAVTATPGTGQVLVEFQVGVGVANGLTLDTFAVYSAGDTELARATAPQVTKTSDLTLAVAWTLHLI